MSITSEFIVEKNLFGKSNYYNYNYNVYIYVLSSNYVLFGDYFT